VEAEVTEVEVTEAEVTEAEVASVVEARAPPSGPAKRMLAASLLHHKGR